MTKRKGLEAGHEYVRVRALHLMHYLICDAAGTRGRSLALCAGEDPLTSQLSSISH